MTNEQVTYLPDANIGRFDRPVVNVSWDNAKAYADWRGKATGKKDFRLPSESEWEYAARSGWEARYPWGDESGFLRIAKSPPPSRVRRSAAWLQHKPHKYV